MSRDATTVSSSEALKQLRDQQKILNPQPLGTHFLAIQRGEGDGTYAIVYRALGRSLDVRELYSPACRRIILSEGYPGKLPVLQGDDMRLEVSMQQLLPFELLSKDILARGPLRAW